MKKAWLSMMTLALLAGAFPSLIKAADTNPPAIDTVNWSNVQWGDTDISSWPVTATLSSVNISGRGITMPYDKAGQVDVCPAETTDSAWPCSYPFGQDLTRADRGGAVGNAWIFVYRDDVWKAATFDYLRPGQISKDTSNITDACGVLHGLGDFTPVAGELYGFLISGVARFGGPENVQEKSNLIMERWTGEVGPSDPLGCSAQPEIPIGPIYETPPPIIIPPHAPPNDGKYVPPTPPAFCLPELPEDLTLLEECLDFYALNPGIYDENSDPVPGPGSGTWGVVTAYNPTNDTLIYVATGKVNGEIRGIFARLYNATTLTPIGNVFRVDQSGFFTGNPQVVYNTTNNQFLVEWFDSRHGIRIAAVYGRVINADGTFAGNDFAIHSEYSVLWPADLNYESTHNRYFTILNTPDFVVLRIIKADGTVLPPIKLDRFPTSPYESMATVTYNSTLNEYWYAFINIVDGSDTTQEDIRVMMGRVNAETLQIVGDPIQITPTRVGRNSVAYPGIEYSAKAHAAVIMWQARGITPGMASEVFGRTIHDDFTMTSIYPVLTSSTYEASDFYGAPNHMKYNPYTDTFILAVEDNNGGTTYAEVSAEGAVLQANQCIPLIGVNGNFWPSVSATRGGAFCTASADYADAYLVFVKSPFQNHDSDPVVRTEPTRDNLDTSNLAIFLSQIYVYALGVAGLIAVMMSVLGGYLVMTARGNDQQVTKGKQYIYSSLTGLLILAASYLILNSINSDLTDFAIPSLDALE